ncbi:MAG: ATP-binding protein [Candidatus Omnitrophota bacterium]
MRKQTWYKRSVRLRIARLICMAVLIVAISALSVGYFLGFRLMRALIGENYARMTEMLASSINRIVSEEVNDAKTYVDSPFWKRAIEESNLRYKTMSPEAAKRFLLDTDKAWVKALPDSPLITEYLGTLLSRRLKNLVKDSETIAEIFVTDKKGALVAASGKTSDFYQSDEEWWQRAFAGGEGKVCLGKIEFDESADTWVIPIAVPIRDESGQVIGVCKCLESIKRFLGHLEDFTIGKAGYAVLANRKGDIIVHKGFEPFSRKFAKDEVLQKIYSTERKWEIIKDPHLHKGKIFVAYAEIMHPHLIESGINWVVFIDQDVDEVFAPLNRLFLQMSVVVAIIILSVIPVAFIFGGIFVKPIEKLSKATKEIAGGDWGYDIKIKTGDEIEELAASFGEMLSSIREKQKALMQAKDKFENLSETLDVKVKERTKQLSEAQEATLNMLEDLQEAKNNIEEALKIKSEFTSVVSHELRTPLTAIKEGIAIVLDGTAGKINAEQKDFLNTAKRNVDRLARLINDVLDFQKLEAGRVEFKMEENDINEVVREIEKEMVPVVKEKKLEFSLKLGKKIPKIEFDRDTIIQVLTNLVNNAVKFTEKGGITVITDYDRKNNAILVSVKDTGLGIRKEDLPRLFQRYEQLEKGKGRKTGGTGLGLAISKEIIKRHNGKIWVESEFGKGASFCFVLPIKERRA